MMLVMLGGVEFRIWKLFWVSFVISEDKPKRHFLKYWKTWSIVFHPLLKDYGFVLRGYKSYEIRKFI